MKLKLTRMDKILSVLLIIAWFAFLVMSLISLSRFISG